MLLTIDVGNTLISIAIYKEDELLHTFQTQSDVNKSLDEYVVIFSSFCNFKNFKKERIQKIIIASVVPILTKIIKEAFQILCDVNALIVGPGVKSGLPLLIDHPLELGSDLVAVSVGAIKKYGKPLTIVDLGTAIKVMAINKDGAFIGTVFHPGLNVSLNALVKSAAQLVSVNLLAPKKVIGKNTFDATNSGVLYGASEMIKGLVNLFEKELGYQTRHILTGGDATYVKDMLSDFIYDRTLVHDGLKEIYLRNERSKSNEK